MPGQLRNVIHAVSERKDVQPVLEIFAKMARRCFLLQVTMCCRDHSHIGVARPVVAYALVSFLLQDAE